MTQLIAFTPQPRSAFQFQPVLDGVTTTGLVTWNISRQGWYVSVYDLSNNRIFTLPLVESPDPSGITSIAWDGLRQRVVATTTAPHGVDLGTETLLTFSGFTPDVFNGAAVCDVLSPNTLAYPMTDDPGVSVTLGTFCPEVDLCGGYFTSRMVYRGSARRFEVTP